MSLSDGIAWENEFGEKPYQKIADHYKSCFEKYGDTPKGLDWDNQDNMNERYKVMLGLLPQQRDEYPTVLDFGCGTGGFYQFIQDSHRRDINYTGIDVNETLMSICRDKFPEKYHNFNFIDIHNPNHQDAFNNEGIFPKYDWIITNGVFTVKGELTQYEMHKFATSTLEKLWGKCNKGIAFNFMSTLVDWKRDDLFHVPLDIAANICKIVLNSRNFEIKHGYGGLYEYTVYCYKQ